MQERNLDLRKCIDISRNRDMTMDQHQEMRDNHFTHALTVSFVDETTNVRRSCVLRGDKSAANVEERTSLQSGPPDVRRKTHGVTREHPHSSHTDGCEDDCILSVETEAMHSMSTHPIGPLYTEMRLPDGKPLRMQIDSGTTVNVMPAKHVGSAKLMHSDVQLRMYNKATVKSLGQCRLYLFNPVNNSCLKKCSKLSSSATTSSASTSIITDLLGDQTTIRSVFNEDVTTQGCFYHLTQNTWWKIQDMELVPLFKDY